MQPETQCASNAKWSGVLEWCEPSNRSYQVLAQFCITQSIPEHYVRWFNELWPKKFLLQLTQEPVSNILCHFGSCFTAEVLSQPCPELNLLKLELASNKVGLTFFTDTDSRAGWGLVLAVSKEHILKGIVFVWDFNSESQKENFVKCLTTLQLKINIDWSKVCKSEVSILNHNNPLNSNKDMLHRKPGPSGSRNHSSFNSHQGRYNSTPKCVIGLQKSFRTSTGQSQVKKVTFQEINRSLQGSNRELQNQRPYFNERHPNFTQRQKQSRWSNSASKANGPERKPGRGSPIDQSWRSARRSLDQVREIQNHENFQTLLHKKIQVPTSHPSNPVGQQASTHQNHTSSLINNNQTIKSVNSKVEHVNVILQTEKSVASTSGQSNPVITPQKKKITITNQKPPEKKQEETSFPKLSPPCGIEQKQPVVIVHESPPPKSQDYVPHSSQNQHGPPPTNTGNIQCLPDPQPSTSQVEQPQRPLSNSSANLPSTTQDEQAISAVVAEYLVPLHDLLKCYKCKLYIGTMHVRSCICSLACVECTFAEPNCPQCNIPFSENCNISWLHHRISSVIHHPCPHVNCVEIAVPGDDHEANCIHKPLECFICGLQFQKSTAWLHFQIQHPQQTPLKEGSNNNVLETQFWRHKETNNRMICCFVQGQFISITLQKFEEEQRHAQFIVEQQQNNSDTNFIVKITFKKDWVFSRQNICKRGTSLSYIEVPLHIVNNWLEGEDCKMDIVISVKNKRKISQNTLSPKKNVNKKIKRGDIDVNK